MTSTAEQRLADYVDGIGDVLGNNKRRKASFGLYAMGLLGEGDRKSVEPIAARVAPDPKAVDAAHQRLLHFLTDSEWSDHDVRRAAARHVLPIVTKHHPVDTWIIDDTGFLKQGSHSVGVQRQYTGSAGKVANCQIGVSLVVTTPGDQVPIDFALYLPRCWADHVERRREARIPDEIQFKTKIQLALDMIGRAVKNEVPQGVVLADSAYGNAANFRAGLRNLGLHYAVGVHHNIKVWDVDDSGIRCGEKLSLRAIAAQTSRRLIRKVTWRDGTKKKLSARFFFCRVVPCRADGTDPAKRENVCLVIEWQQGEKEPSNYYLSSLPQKTARKELVRIIKQRWRTEQVYQELKGELGLDHFEGRRFAGWHHHVSVVLCCYAYVSGERSGAFSPSAPGEEKTSPQLLAA